MALCCQDVTSLIVRHLTSQGSKLLSYIDDFGGMASTEAEATHHFNSLHTSLRHLGLQEAAHKISPTQGMIWLCLTFDTINMSTLLYAYCFAGLTNTDTIHEKKMAESMQLIEEWSHKSHTTIHELWVILGKLFFMWPNNATK